MGWDTNHEGSRLEPFIFRVEDLSNRLYWNQLGDRRQPFMEGGLTYFQM